jgi:riboflavin synthase
MIVLRLAWIVDKRVSSLDIRFPLLNNPVMFNGIIETTARVIGVSDGPSFRRLTLANQWDDLRHGESIAINGVCLTVAELPAGEIGFDVIPETLSLTNLGALQQGDRVNTERAMRVGDRIDGHFVQGHVDGVGRLLEQIRNDTERRLRIQAPDALARYLVPKGSITIDGVSLTLAQVEGSVFEVALIPTTVKLTTLGDRAPGWLFNLEADVLSKTIISWLERREQSVDDRGVVSC